MAEVLVAGQPSLLPSGNGKVAVSKEQGGNLRPETIHVLLIDDERLSRLVVGNLLRKCRYRVTAVATGMEALQALRSNAPGTFQLVLTDVMMPDVDGIEVLRHVRQDEGLSSVPVVMMSANEQQDTVFECIRAGAEDYLLKPLTKKEVQYIWMHVWRRQHQPALRQPSLSQGEEQSLIQANSGSQQLSTAASSGVIESATLQVQPQQQQQQQQLQEQAPATPPVVSNAVQPVATLPFSSMTVSNYVLSCRAAPHPENSFRVFCAALAMLQPLHVHGIACGCLRPSQLLLHHTGQVTAQPNLPVTAAEHALYTSPEAHATQTPTTQSDIFSLGILFFELLVAFPEHPMPRTLADIRQQLLTASTSQLSPQLAFLGALLNPEPSKRPTIAQILGGNLLSMLHSAIGSRPQERLMPHPQHQAIRFPRLSQQQHQLRQQLQQHQQASAVAQSAATPKPSIAQADAALLEDFLRIMSKKTATTTARTEQQLAWLDQDIREVNGKLLSMVHQTPSELLHQTSAPQLAADASKLHLQHPASRKRQRSWELDSSSHLPSEPQLALTDSNEQKKERVEQSWKNAIGAFTDLEKMFFKRREAASTPVSPSRSDASDGDHMPPGLAGLSDHLTDFCTDLTNFSCYSRLQVKAELNYSDLLTVPDMVCSTAFDRDDEFFATAGVYRRVKIFDFASVQDNDTSIHYPILEIPSRSKLSSVCWNSYVKSNLICSDYEGVIQLWDVSQHTETMTFDEHAKRVWSVDFSQTDPTRFVSGSDDGTVRLWSIADENAVATIDSKANVCSVQFSPTDSNLMAFGSANYRVYLYDLRQISAPLAVIGGHTKAVSYVRWVGSNQVISASTDNHLKLWDVADAALTGGNCQPVTSFSGHTNEKNFVGLSVSRDNYIACGSENNSVYCYHKAVPTPICNHNFADGQQADPADAHQFVSSVCWSRKSNTMISANSLGNIKVLELV